MVNRISFSGIFLFLIKEDVFPFLQKSWNSSWWIKLISQQVRFWEFFIKSPAFREKHQLAAFIIQYKIQKKGTFYNLKCKRFLKLMTLRKYAISGECIFFAIFAWIISYWTAECDGPLWDRIKILLVPFSLDFSGFFELLPTGCPIP